MTTVKGCQRLQILFDQRVVPCADKQKIDGGRFQRDVSVDPTNRCWVNTIGVRQALFVVRNNIDGSCIYIKLNDSMRDQSSRRCPARRLTDLAITGCQRASERRHPELCSALRFAAAASAVTNHQNGPAKIWLSMDSTLIGNTHRKADRLVHINSSSTHTLKSIWLYVKGY